MRKLFQRYPVFLLLLLLVGVVLYWSQAALAYTLRQAELTKTGGNGFVVVPPGDAVEQEAPTATPPVPVDAGEFQAGEQPDLPADEEDGAVQLPEGWLPPINLSQSGATANPQMVRDSQGDLHVMWRDEIDGFAYTYGQGDTWSDPVTLELPFFTRRYFPDLEEEDETPLFEPVLATDNVGNIHAFWINELDDDLILYHSSVPRGELTTYDAWSERQALDDAARKVSWALSDNGRLHVAYIRPSELEGRPSGLYYRRLEADGTWSEPTLLYASRYLRGVSAGEANIHLMADGNNVYAAWDDTGREQVFLARSTNGGLTWQDGQAIDQRTADDDETAPGASGIAIGSDGEVLLLSWRGGHEPGQACAQYMSISSDRGETWSPREQLESVPGCLTRAQFVANEAGLFLLGTTEQEVGRDEIVQTAYMLAWDGAHWSDPQLQEPLTRFTNPDTFQAVTPFCLQGMDERSQIMFLGCDRGQGRDIWLLAREAADIEGWFPEPSVWIGPEDTGENAVETADLQLVVDGEGTAHALWRGAEPGQEIYHASWNGTSWSAGRPVLQTPGGDVLGLTTAADGDRLYAVWRDSTRGLTFSQAAAARPGEWAEPQLVTNETAASAPNLTVASDGRLVLAYAVALNERRGIYLMESADGGASWKGPGLVFDGTAAGWEMVDTPRLAATGDGQLHLLWTRRTLPPEGTTLALVYSRSVDGGETWTEPQTVSEMAVVWSDILSAGQGRVHRLWAEENDEELLVWHDTSINGGRTWARATQMKLTSAESMLAAMIDAGLQPHLLTLESGSLEDLVWDGTRWLEGEAAAIPLRAGGELAVAGSGTVQVLALVSGQVAGADEETAGADEETAGRRYFLWRPFDTPPEIVAPQATQTATPQPTAGPEATATPEPTATVVFVREQEAQPDSLIPGLAESLGEGASIVAMAIIPAMILVLVGIIVGVRLLRRR